MVGKGDLEWIVRHNTEGWYRTPEELQKYVWDDLNERRKKRICARCGFKGSHYIHEVDKYSWYEIRSHYEIVENSIDEQAHKTGSPICTECGLQIIGKKPRVFQTSSEIFEIVSKRYNRIRELIARKSRLENGDLSNEERELNEPQIEAIKRYIDGLVNLYNIK